MVARIPLVHPFYKREMLSFDFFESTEDTIPSNSTRFVMEIIADLLTNQEAACAEFEVHVKSDMVGKPILN